MNLLLDTHALMWLVRAPDRLGPNARTAIERSGSIVHASHVSLWELSIKCRLGKLDLGGWDALEWFEHYLPRTRLREMSIETAELGALQKLPLLHGDPFDRLLVTQAQRRGATLVTKDQAISQYDVDTIW